MDPDLGDLNDCGCCEGLGPRTPAAIFNRPGLDAVAYRVGTHSQFYQSMLAALSGAGRPALVRLTTRAPDDFAVALLDAWATVADVLTFYQERIANESYMRTATERRSVLELARTIGYELRPGVAASTYLAFTLEGAAGAPGYATLDVGTKMQSVPGPDEKPQTFETVEKLAARAAWNELKPLRAQPQIPSAAMTSVTARGVSVNVPAGSKLLIVAGSGEADRVVKRVVNVAVDNESQTTRLAFVINPAAPTAFVKPDFPPGQVFFERMALGDEVVRNRVLPYAWKAEDLVALAAAQGWSLDALEESVRRLAATPPTPSPTGVFALRQRAALFGHNAPRWDSLPASQRIGEWVVKRNADGSVSGAEFVSPAYPNSWEGRTLAQDQEIHDGKQVYLDSTYPGILPDSWLVLENPSPRQKVYRVQSNVETSRSAFALSAKVTLLTLSSNADFEHFKLRETTVLAQSEALVLADLPIPNPVQGNQVTLDGVFLRLRSGQKVILTGERADLPGVKASEVRTLAEVKVERRLTTLTFQESLAYSYVRPTVTLNANTAFATHGESVTEVLGSGDAGQPYQRFTLREAPLTYTSSDDPSGGDSTLEVRVNDLKWDEVPMLYGRGPRERIYVTRRNDDGKTTVQFGDGYTGARPPTDRENVRATYRKGIGREGLVKADQLTLLLTRPLGVKGVTNPLPAAGAQDPQALADARRNAPPTVLTLDRAVSLRDYEDFAQFFSGIAKAHATWVWTGQARGVFVTVAGPAGDAVLEESPLHLNLVSALQNAGDRHVPVFVRSYSKVPFQLAAQVTAHPDRRADRVLADVRLALREHFDFERRALGQPVTLSEVVAVFHGVPGVTAVRVSLLYRGTTPAPQTYLAAQLPHEGDAAASVLPAELLLLAPASLDSVEVLP